MRWYAVNTLSGSEDKAMRSLQQRIDLSDIQDRFGHVLVPSETVVDPKTKKETVRRFYPGYMLVEMVMDNETWHLVQNTPIVDHHGHHCSSSGWLYIYIYIYIYII